MTLELYHPGLGGDAKSAAKSRRFGTGRCDSCRSGNRFGKVLRCEVGFGSRSGKLVGLKVPTALGVLQHNHFVDLKLTGLSARR